MKNYDVIIMGGGSAGLNAALVIKQAGYSPVVIEKMPKVGGNSIKSSSGMNASETQFQRQQGILDHNEGFYQETLLGGHGTNDPALLRYFVDHSAQAIQWLDSLGIMLDQLTMLGGMTTKRTHRPHDGSAIGGYLMHHLYDEIQRLNIPLMTETTVMALLQDEQKHLTGVTVQQKDQMQDIMASAVVIASGGFGANRDWISQYRPELKETVTTNSPGNVGDGIRLAESVGADTVDMAEIQIHPTVHQETGMLIGEAVRGEGAILVNQAGERFANELAPRDVLSQAIKNQPGQKAYLLFDAGVRERVPALNFYAARGLVTMSDSVEALAKQLGLPGTQVVDTVNAWNQAVQTGEDRAYKRIFPDPHPLEVGPFGGIPVAPGIHFTMGGIKTNPHAEVLTKTGQIIPGLFASGEVVGGLHGKNRLGGNAIAETVVFGTRAGQSAVDYLKHQV